MRVSSPEDLRNLAEAITDAARGCPERRLRMRLFAQAAELDATARALEHAARRRARRQRAGKRRPAVLTVDAATVGLACSIVAASAASVGAWRPVELVAGLLVGFHCCVLTFGLVGPNGLLRGPSCE